MSTLHNSQLDNTILNDQASPPTTPLNINVNENQPQANFETIAMDEFSFFYNPRDDFQIYHITCKEMRLSFESVSQLIDNNTDSTDNDSHNNYVLSNDIYTFYHKQPEIKKIYQVTCEMVSHSFVFQFLNKVVYGIHFTQDEHYRQEFSKRHQENLKFHLEKDLISYLVPKNVYQDYCTNADMQQHNDQSFISQQDSNNSSQDVDI